MGEGECDFPSAFLRFRGLWLLCSLSAVCRVGRSNFESRRDEQRREGEDLGLALGVAVSFWACGWGGRRVWARVAAGAGAPRVFQLVAALLVVAGRILGRRSGLCFQQVGSRRIGGSRPSSIDRMSRVLLFLSLVSTPLVKTRNILS
jgi:hypothetical protein